MKNKKRMLLLGVGAMSAMALAVGATSTFAWYQASTTAAEANTTVEHETVSVAIVNYSASAFDVPLALSINQIGTDGNAYSGNVQPLELAHFYTSTEAAALAKADKNEAFNAAGLYHAYYQGDANSSLVYKKAVASGHDDIYRYAIKASVVAFPAANAVTDAAITEDGGKFVVVEEAVKFQDKDGNRWTRDQLLGKLDGQHIKFKAARKDGDESRAMFYDLSTTAAQASFTNDSAVTATPEFVNGIDLDIDTANNNIDVGQVIGYLSVYCEGQTEGNVHENSETSINANFTVTVQAR